MPPIASRSLMRWLIISLAVAATSASSAQARARIPCRPAPGSRTIAQSSKARIFSYPESDGNDYACLYSNGHPRYLSTTEHYDYYLVRFAGPYVAFVQEVNAEQHIGVMNLRTGHLERYEVASQIGNIPCAGRANGLVLKSDGAIGWIATNFPMVYCSKPPAEILEVHRHDRRGFAVLDQGIAIDPDSLALSGSLLLWLDAEHVNGATLL